MITLLATILSAAPVHLIAVHGPSSGSMVKKLTVAGAKTIDASPLREYLFRAGLMQDFEAFKAAPPPGWAPAPVNVWTEGLAHCRSLAGPPPWTNNAPTVVACSKRLSTYLWQQYAAHHTAARVFEVDISRDNETKYMTVSGLVWEPGIAVKQGFSESGPEGELEKHIEKVATALIQKKGSPSNLELIPVLSAAYKGDVFVGEEKITTPITFKKSCAALPKTVTLTPAGVLADSFAARWTPEGAAGPAQACSVTFDEHEESMGLTGGGPKMTVIATIMTCGANTVAIETAKSPMLKRPLVDLISERLAQGLVAKLCK